MTSLRWGRIIAGGFLVELGIIVVFVPVVVWGTEQASQITAVAACFPMAVLFSWWAARKAPSQHIVHGFLVGLVATVMYLLLTIGQELPGIYMLGHVFKILGGVAGGWWASKQAVSAA